MGDSTSFMHWNDAGTFVIKGPEFSLISNASNSTISATNGSIGGWSLDPGAFTSTQTSLYSNTGTGHGRGLYIDDGSKDRIIVSDTTAFATSVSLSLAGTTGTASPTGIEKQGAIYNNNTAAEAVDGTFTASTSFSVSAGQEISISDNVAYQIRSGNPATYWLDVTGGTGTTFALTYHFVYFEVVGGGLNLTAANGGAPLIVNGSVHYYSSAYHKSLSSSGASVVASSSGTVTVTLRHKVGIDYLGTGQELELKPGPIASKSISKGDAPQTVEICQAGIQAFYGSNFFKVNTNAGSSDFVDIKGTTTIDGQLTGTNASFDTANITSLTISELSVSSTQLTLPGDLRVTGDLYVLATSDEKLKTNIIPIKNPLLKLSWSGCWCTCTRSRRNTTRGCSRKTKWI